MRMTTERLVLLLLLEHYKAKLLAGVRVTPTGCWEWTRSGDGRYGHFYMLGAKFKTHVAAAILWRGIVLRTRVLRHQCDNPACCNPAHLLPGTQKQNRQEAAERGRAVGLTVAKVARIRNLLTRKHSQAEVARRCQVDPSTVSRIARGETR